MSSRKWVSCEEGRLSVADEALTIDETLTAEECELLQAVADGWTVNEYAEKGGVNLCADELKRKKGNTVIAVSKL